MGVNRLVVRRKTWNGVRDYLLADGREHLCFILAEHVSLGNASLLLEKDLHLIEDNELDGGGAWDGLSLKLDALLQVMNHANKEQCVLIEVHSHPFADGAVYFSSIDLQGQKEMVSYLSDAAPGKVYGALVVGKNSVKGQFWLPGNRGPLPLDRIRIVGPVLEDIRGDGKLTATQAGANTKGVEGVYHRQILALGGQGQRKIAQVSVAIVGLGGMGSIVAQELAYLGVGEFLLIDDDAVETTNLHRVVGTTKKDVGKTKVKVALEHIKRINPKAQVKALCVNVRSLDALRLLKGSNLIFGCVDTDSARLILSELASSYLISYLDCGVGITVKDGEIVEAGGRVVVWTPGRPCLLCAREVNTRIAAEELETPNEREFRRRHGYVAGSDVPEPAVISLNGTVASLAVTEFLALVAGFRDSHHYTYYDMVGQRVGPRIVQREEKCVVCALEGYGDKSKLDRYSKCDLPSDLPL